MKALIIKDFLLLQKQLKLVVGVMVVYAILFVPQGMLDMVPFMLLMFAAMYTMTCMSFDETLKWDIYALSGPVNRRQVVTAKYLFALLLLLSALVLGLLSYIIAPQFLPWPRPLAQSATILLSMCFGGVMWMSLMIPLMNKLGVEKSRLLMVAAILVPIAVVMLYNKYASPELTAFFISYINYLPPALLLLAIAAVALSYKISLNIYCNKEF